MLRDISRHGARGAPAIVEGRFIHHGLYLGANDRWRWNLRDDPQPLQHGERQSALVVPPRAPILYRGRLGDSLWPQTRHGNESQPSAGRVSGWVAIEQF